MDDLERVHRWFRSQGLPYFAPEGRARARAALRPRRWLPPIAAISLVTAAIGGVLAWVSEDVAAAPATLLTAAGAAAAWYGLSALGAAPVVTWAAGRTLRSLPQLLPMILRALPLLLIFNTFLFINAEVWEVAGNLPAGLLWLTVLLFGTMAVGFLLVRLPEEVDRSDDDVDDALLLAACAGTPLEDEARRQVADPRADPAAHAEVTGFERANLILVLLVVQAVQVLLVAVSVFVFFMVFGALVMRVGVVRGWTGDDDVRALPVVSNISVELAQVSLFLAAFSGLYFTVVAVTDETFRGQFFSGVVRELQRAVGVRAVYRCWRARPGATA